MDHLGATDMAPIKFVKAISNGDPIDVYNKRRDVERFHLHRRLGRRIFRLIFAIPDENENRKVKVRAR